MIIILNGLTGSGKSTSGKFIAKTLNYNFIDLDKYIENELFKSIDFIFENKGEIYFREKESEFLTKILSANKDNLVLSLGGGTFKNNSNVEICLKHGIVVWIDMNIDILVLRLKDISHKPLLKNSNDIKKTLQKMLDERISNYEKSHIKINFDKNYPLKYISDHILKSIDEYCIKNNLGQFL